MGLYCGGCFVADGDACEGRTTGTGIHTEDAHCIMIGFDSFHVDFLLVSEGLSELLPLPCVPHHVHLRSSLSLLILHTALQLQATQEVSAFF